jgi:hypothetical protein
MDIIVALMHIQNTMPAAKKKRSRRPAKRQPAKTPETPTDTPPRLELSCWPQLHSVDGEPRDAVFDWLHEEDERALRQRGYRPIILRAIPTSSPKDVVLYNRYLLRGVIDGTVNMTKQRAEALELDMRHRQMLAKVNISVRTPIDEKAGIQQLLDWDRSRHSMAESTVVDVETIKQWAAESTARSRPRKRKKKRKKDDA